MKIFVTGIGTDVGKTVASAIITEALEADYWKPVQAGDLENSDSHKIERYISNRQTIIHPSAYKLMTPASPHLSAMLDNIIIDINKITEPETDNHLVVEGAGGLLVPLNDTDTIANLIQPDYKVIIVSRHYLGSINHTLLTCEVMKNRGITISGIIFNGDENSSTEEIILKKTGIPMIGRIENEPYFDANVVKYYADKFLEKLLGL
ncbi:dethiobiotin synthase [Flavobacterium sp. J372]|uniref:dethiobiotin synthase n=1 Tax=Flavobacterium sp. J372 TaxID=2898436 RepID=UPI002151B6B6|nr:dethiobiotin synthase [Flavobacterium sp. J372]MCR5861285.1 dethiobiotin synthase [Flavobacterium sp. J372]MCR5863675.1 dethiobiotin synthase [Flavobacterium sp. J372]